MTRKLAAGVLAGLALLTAPAVCTAQDNPPAEGFDLAGSDAEAIAVADRVMEKMGGRDAWDATRFITWRFFGRRFHVWDKHTGDVRVEGVERDSEAPYVILMNIHTKEGRAWRSGEEVVEPEALAELLDRGESAWINDSYWLVMPYKLKDSGVTLTYLGDATMEDGRESEALQLTFAGVGRTPENKYHVHVAKDSGLVEQWDFYTEASDEEPRFKTPWHGWEPHGAILLSADRGRGAHTDVAVLEELPAGALTSPEPVGLEISCD